MRRLCVVLCAVAAAFLWQPAAAAAADVTFTRDVAPILHARCVSCHRAGEVAPMALLTFEDARPCACDQRASRQAEMTATYPDGRQQTLLNVPAYDFNWQLFYYPKQSVRLPRGTRVDLVAHYDNSAANKHHPDPTKAVTFGEGSSSEMMFGMFEFTSVAGVSPTPATDRARMEALVATLPSDSSFLIDLSLGKDPMPAMLHVPRTGEGALYTQTMGMILPQPVAKLEWQGDAFGSTRCGGRLGLEADSTR